MAENHSVQLSGQGDRPQWLPEKFKTPEDLVQSYTELEKKLGGKQDTPQDQQQTTTQDNPLQIPPKTDTNPDPEAELQPYFDEFERTGTLSTESRAKLDAKFGKKIVEGWIKGQTAARQSFADEVFALGGGEEQYKSMLNWATTNLDKSDIEAFNAALNSGNKASIKLAVEGLKSQFTAAFGDNPELSGGKASKTADSDVFESDYQVVEAMKDPRYNVDPAYTKKIEDKIARSPAVLGG